MRTKEKLIEKILHIDDESILEGIMRVVDVELGFVREIVELSSEQKKFIDEGIKDIEEGRYISHEESKRRSKEWLKGQ